LIKGFGAEKFFTQPKEGGLYVAKSSPGRWNLFIYQGNMQEYMFNMEVTNLFKEAIFSG
jgi:hypothetical protein